MCEQCEEVFTPYEVEHGNRICLMCQLVILLDLPTCFFKRES